jgi:hypothetical protein
MEWGSPDFDEPSEDMELKAIVEQRLEQEEVEVDLDFNPLPKGSKN